MAAIADETSTNAAAPHARTLLSAQMKTVLALLLFAAVVRGGVLWARFDDLSADPDGYREIAVAVQRSKLYARKPYRGWSLTETAFRPPLYPYTLVALAGDGTLTPLRIALLHWVLGVATVLLTYYLARAWELSRSGAWLAAALVALDPILLRQSPLVMTETLATFIAVLLLIALTRFGRRPDAFEASLVGLALGVSILCRPTFMAYAVIIAVCLPLVRASLSGRALNLVACLAIAAVVIAPWMWRNKVDLGTAVVTTTHGGYTLALGNNTSFYEHLASGAAWQTPFDSGTSNLRQDIRSAWRRGTTSAHWEIEYDHAAYLVALDAMRDNPGMFASSCVYRLWRLWSPLAMQLSPDESRGVRAVRYAVAIWYVAVFGLAVIGARQLGWRLWQPPWLWGVLLCLSFTLVHTFYWSDMRMRAPLMPVVAMFAAGGCALVWNRVRQRANPPAQS